MILPKLGAARELLVLAPPVFCFCRQITGAGPNLVGFHRFGLFILLLSRMRFREAGRCCDFLLDRTQTGLRLTIRGFHQPDGISSASSGSDRSAVTSRLGFRLRSLDYIRGVFPYVSASACAFHLSQSHSTFKDPRCWLDHLAPIA